MKYAIVLNGDQNAPHLKIYTNILDEKCVPYDVISWDRGGSFEKSEFTYTAHSDVNQSSISRLWSYMKFALFIKQLIKKYKYEKLIVISPQVALFMPFFLKRRYKKRYIFDYRDLSIEQKAPFKPFLRMVLENSYVNVISSPGFKEYLPKGYDYVLSHNFNIKTVNAALEASPEPLPAGDIKLLTIGAIRFDANYDVIDSLGNAEGVRLNFVGKGDAAPVFEKYATDKGYTNIAFKGLYKKEEEGDIIKQNTMINIFYPNWPSHITALSNRFYNSLVFKRPMLVTKGGTQGFYVEKYGVGLAVEDCGGLATKMKDYLTNLDFSDYIMRCNNLLKEFEKDYQVFAAVVDSFIDS